MTMTAVDPSGAVGAESRSNAKQPRIALSVSHPIQHFCPQYASLARSSAWQFRAFFASSMGKVAYHDANFGRSVAWNDLKLEEFEHEFLSEEPLESSARLDAPQIGKRLEAFQPDVLIVYGYWQAFQRRACNWASNKPTLVYYIADSEFTHERSAWRTLAKSTIARRRLKGVDRFLSVGDANEHYFRLCGASMDSLTRMCFPIDIKLYSEAWAHRSRLRAKNRARYGFAEDDVVVSNVGKFVDRKRQADLVRAICASPEATRLRALLVGAGPNDATLQALASELGGDRVVFAGFVQPTNLPGCYAASDIYAHVSSYEPHSLAISEAAFMGLPIVASDRCGSYGPTDDVQPGGNGVVFATGNAAALGAALEEIVLAPELRRRFGDRSRAHAHAAQKRAHGGFLEDALTADGLLT